MFSGLDNNVWSWVVSKSHHDWADEQRRATERITIHSLEAARNSRIMTAWNHDYI